MTVPDKAAVPVDSRPRAPHLIFGAAGLAAAIVVAWLAAIVQAHWAPILVFPLVCGAVLGLALSALKHWLEPSGPWVSVTALIGGVILAGGLHYFSYRHYVARQDQARANKPEAWLAEELFPESKTDSFLKFLQWSARARNVGPWQLRGAQVWASWLLEAALVVTATFFAARARLGGARESGPSHGPDQLT